MKEQLRALYDLQAIDVRIAQASAQIAALTGSKDLRAKYSKAKMALQQAEQVLGSYESEARDKELQVKSVEEKLGKFEKRLYSGSIVNPKELSATEKEIEILKTQRGDLDVRTLELYEQVDSAKAKVESLGEIVQTVETQARKAIKREAGEKTRLETEIAELNKQRAVAAEKITDRSLLSKYEAMRKRIGTGIAKVLDGKCEGCHVSITSFTMSNLFQDNEIQTCENCGRILFLDIQ